MPTLYEKRGRRYQFWGSAEQWNSCDMLKAGDFRLEYHAGNGERQYSYITDPALAQVEAALMVARAGVIKAINARAVATPSVSCEQPYTARQRELIERFRADMEEAGGLVPHFWNHATASELADAAIEAVRAAMKD